MNTDRAPSAATHACPGGCDTELPAKLFACTRCFRQLPHRLRQDIVRTRPRKYLDAERLAAVHAAEDYLDGLRNPEAKPPPKPSGNAISRATEAALEKKELSERLGAACAVEYARRKEQLPAAMALPQRQGRGKR